VRSLRIATKNGTPKRRHTSRTLRCGRTGVDVVDRTPARRRPSHVTIIRAAGCRLPVVVVVVVVVVRLHQLLLQLQRQLLLLLLLLLTLSLLGFLAAGPTVRRCLLGRCRSHGARVHRRNHWLPVTVRLRAILKTAVLKNRICGRFKLRSASAGWIQLPGLQTSAG